MTNSAQKIRRFHNGVPVLWGYIERDPRSGNLRVWCSWCCHWHIHGAPSETPGDITHRTEHCFVPGGPYRERGYWIDITDVPFSRVRKTVRSATAAQRRAMATGRISDAVRRLREQRPALPVYAPCERCGQHCTDPYSPDFLALTGCPA
jgi:hypothetical protein